jgi:DNA-binding PadR family transcriptional regulator
MNLLGSNMEIVENKLILLYFLDRVAIPVSNLQIIKIFLKNRFMNYFFLQQFINDLVQLEFLSAKEKEGKTFYTITQKGKENLLLLSEKIPVGVKKRIDSSVSEIKRQIRNETLISADYTPESENEYVVKLSIREDSFSLIEINLVVGSKNDAKSICSNWKNHSRHIYPEIINCLVREYDEKGST